MIAIPHNSMYGNVPGLFSPYVISLDVLGCVSEMRLVGAITLQNPYGYLLLVVWKDHLYYAPP